MKAENSVVSRHLTFKNSMSLKSSLTRTDMISRQWFTVVTRTVYETATYLMREKFDPWAINWWKLPDFITGRFVTIPACNRQTDGQTQTASSSIVHSVTLTRCSKRLSCQRNVVTIHVIWKSYYVNSRLECTIDRRQSVRQWQLNELLRWLPLAESVM